MQPVRLSFVFYDIKSKWISHRHSCNVYMRSLCGIATTARPRTATHDYAASCRGLCMGRVFHPAQRPVERAPTSSILLVGLQNETSERSTSYRRTLIHNPLPSLASEKKCIREYIFIFATLYSRYVSYLSLGVFVPTLIFTHFGSILKTGHNVSTSQLGHVMVWLAEISL